MVRAGKLTIKLNSSVTLGVLIMPARIEKRPFLDARILRSRSHWMSGRTEDFSAIVPRLALEDVTARHATVAEKDGVQIGLCRLDEHDGYQWGRLLLIDRPFINTGVGRLMRRHVTRQANALGARTIGIGANSHADTLPEDWHDQPRGIRP